jgi:predicted permease
VSLLVSFLVLMTLIMTIACMNLANMMLARGLNRRKELAIRLAVGASRFRIVRQMINEGILLSLLGGISGFMLAYGITKLNAHFAVPSAVPIESDFTPDRNAAVFVFLLAVASGIGFSLLPALRATTTDLTPALKQAAMARLPGHRRFGLRNLLIVCQVTGSLILLLVTGFLVMGLTKLNGIQTRVDPHTMYLLSVDPVRQGYAPEQAKAVIEKLVANLKSAGAVSSVALAAQPPFSIPDEDARIHITVEHTAGGPTVRIPVIEQTVGADYFSTLAEPMLMGREFTDADQRVEHDTGKAVPAILNETAARELGAVASAIGQRVRDNKQSYEVVGIIGDLKDTGRLSGKMQPLMYLPLSQHTLARPPADGITVIVRLNAGTDALNSIRHEIASTDANLTIFNVRTLSEYLDRSRSASRLAIDTYGGMGLFGLILAAVGLAGVTGYAVAQRRKEIGIRMALGARKGQVLCFVLREAIEAGAQRSGDRGQRGGCDGAAGVAAWRREQHTTVSGVSIRTQHIQCSWSANLATLD